HLGIDTLPVIDDATRAVGLEWKVTAARLLIEDALRKGRDVFWIEDFKGTFPDIDGVAHIDTTGTGFLMADDLPDPLRPDHTTP
ncbi:MAG: hypothetical protein GXP36_09820, partial [Actinobacteria bacterium]|nr:hypothetical protein [Actinomycetota bacterium]